MKLKIEKKKKKNREIRGSHKDARTVHRDPPTLEWQMRETGFCNQNAPLDFFVNTAEMHTNEKLAIHCKGGNRSVIAASILKSKGAAVIDIMGGFDELKKTNLPVGKTEVV